MDASLPPLSRPVLILGAGVNGLCVARELALNGVSVVVVDRHDVGSGASAKSSRLIHGGLRYLEYGEFRLVRESLDERARLLELAAHHVRPLRLHIPVRRRRGGLIHAAVRFVGLARSRWVGRLLSACRIPAERGLWAAQIGLTLYDAIARAGGLPRHRVSRVTAENSPQVDPARYRWMCSYWDAQMAAPERFAVALARDASVAARATGCGFQLHTYHHVRLQGATASVAPVTGGAAAPALVVRPAMIVNATGAWGDLSLAELPVEAPRMFGGTRGSHIVTRLPALRSVLGDDAVYAESPDGRLVFVLPWADAVLIGTTDVRFEGDPADAVATPEEIGYLVQMVNEVFPQVGFEAGHIDCHYSGVRPLPYVPEGRTAAISRDHAIDTRITQAGLRIDTLIGGKLTTCRAFGEQAADRVLEHLGVDRTADTRARRLPASADYPQSIEELGRRMEVLCSQSGLAIESVRAVWRLLGTESAGALCAQSSPAEPQLLPGTELPIRVVDWIIANEYVQAVEDLVERRLLLAFSPALTWETLHALEDRIRSVRGDCLHGAADAVESLRRNYGISLVPREPE